MKIACGVIRDLLPLYAEKMTGEESNALIREHLDECKYCSDYLEKLQNPIDNDITMTSPSNENALKLVRKGIRSRKVTAVLFSALLVFVVMLTAFSRIVKPDYISYLNSGITVVESGNDDVYARFSDSVTSCKLIKSVNEDNQSVVEIQAWTSLWDRILGKTTPSVLISSKTDKTDIVYYDDLSTKDGKMTAIYGTDTEGNFNVLPRLVPGYYFIAALIATVIIGLACILLRKNKKASPICRYLFAAPLSYMLSHLIITTVFASFSATNDIILNCIASLAIYGVLIFGTSLLRQHKQDTITEQKEEHN